MSRAIRGSPMITRPDISYQAYRGRSRYFKPVAASVAIFAVLLLVSAFVYTPHPADAALGPKSVRGYVWDNDHNPLVGASVEVNIRDPIIRATLSDTTDSNGFYTVTFGMSDWDEGDTIEVIADYDIYQDSNSTTADALPFQYVNVTITGFVIPEFGDIGMPIAVFGLLAMFMAIAWRRKSQQ